MAQNFVSSKEQKKRRVSQTKCRLDDCIKLCLLTIILQFQHYSFRRLSTFLIEKLLFFVENIKGYLLNHVFLKRFLNYGIQFKNMGLQIPT